MNSLIFFFIGILSSQKISLFGEIYIGEILCGIVILSNLKSIRLPENTKTTFGLLFVWFLAQLVADIVNQTEAIKAVKGILVPVFVTIIILGLNTAFYNRYKYLPLYLFGVFVGLWLNKIVSGSTYYEYNSWKWGLGTSVALCFFTWIEFYCKRNKATYLLVGCAIFVVICLANSARIMAALILMASIISVFANSIVKMNIYRHLSCSPYGFLQFLFVLIITLFIIEIGRAHV